MKTLLGRTEANTPNSEVGDDGNTYILGARAFNMYMNKKYGAPTHKLENITPKAVADFLKRKTGIYTMVTKSGTISGHVDLIISGIPIGSNGITNFSNVKVIEIWELN